MDKKVVSFNVFKKTLNPDDAKKIMHDAASQCYWKEVEESLGDNLFKLTKKEIDDNIEQYELNMTEADFDAEGFIPEYLHYLENVGRKNDLSVCLRWAIDDEMEDLDALEEGESLKNLGGYWVKNEMSTFNYSPKQKYLHFFPSTSYRDRNTFLQAIDEEDNHKTTLCAYLIDDDLLEACSGSGDYPEEDDSHRENFSEMAIPSKKLTKDNYVDSFNIKQTRCENYDHNEHINKILKGLGIGDIWDNGDDYEWGDN